MPVPTEEKVMLAILHGSSVSAAHYDSLIAMLLYDERHGRRIIGGQVATKWSGSSGIPMARNEVTKTFLDDTDNDWLFWLDSDMTIRPEIVEAMCMFADAEKRPVLGALNFGQRAHRLDVMKNPVTSMFPVIYSWHETEERFVQIGDFPRNGLMQVAGTGSAAIMIHRSVMEQIREEIGPVWYHLMPTSDGTEYFGEDLSFCRRLLQLDIPIWIHTGISTGHHKHLYANEDAWVQECQHLPIVAIIPTKDNLGMVKPLVESLGGQAETSHILVFDNGSTDGTKEWLQSQDIHPAVVAIDAAGKSLHEMWNEGIDWARDQYNRCVLLILNDDLEIGPNFAMGMRRALFSDWNVILACPNYDGRPGHGYQDLTRAGICAGRYDGTGGLSGFAMAMRSESDYKFPSGEDEAQWWFGDTDLSLSVLKQGGKTVMALDTTVTHIGGGGQSGGSWVDGPFAERIEKDREWFDQKWSAWLADKELT